MTDDFSLAYMTCKAIVDARGKIDKAVGKKRLSRGDEKNYSRFMGPTTRQPLKTTGRGAATTGRIVTTTAKLPMAQRWRFHRSLCLATAILTQAIKDAIVVARQRT